MEEETCNRPIKCANCGDEHKATDLSCNTYKFRMEKLNELREKYNYNRPSATRRFKDAVPPTENIWQIRRDKLKQAKKTSNIEYSTGDESSEAEAAAFPRLRSRQTTTEQRKEGHRLKTSEYTTDSKTVSDLLNLAKEYQLLGNKFSEAVRFLTDFLTIFKKANKDDRAMALLDIMMKIDEYDF